MTQFKEGQEVEVWGANMYPWRKAKILGKIHAHDRYRVEFANGSRDDIDEDHIRAKERSPIDGQYGDFE